MSGDIGMSDEGSRSRRSRIVGDSGVILLGELTPKFDRNRLFTIVNFPNDSFYLHVIAMFPGNILVEVNMIP
jgi:hypothetical protein